MTAETKKTIKYLLHNACNYIFEKTEEKAILYQTINIVPSPSPFAYIATCLPETIHNCLDFFKRSDKRNGTQLDFL